MRRIRRDDDSNSCSEVVEKVVFEPTTAKRHLDIVSDGLTQFLNRLPEEAEVFQGFCFDVALCCDLDNDGLILALDYARSSEQGPANIFWRSEFQAVVSFDDAPDLTYFFELAID